MKKIVMAFGAFDGVHPGHLYYLKEAKKLGNYLIVSIARDKPIWTFAGYKLNENERKKLVESLHIADKVILGSKTDALARIEQVRPSVVAVTGYHPVDARLLQDDLKRRNLRAKVVLIKKYKPKIYDKYFKLDKQIRQVMIKMKLPPKKK